MSTSFPAAPSRPFSIRSTTPALAACKVCGANAPLFGVEDFNRSCEELRGVFQPLSGVAIYYRRCQQCGLIFTDALDDWSDEDFAAHIYNDSYGAVDPDFETKRPTQSADLVTRTFAAQKAGLDVLDYGGGNGVFAQGLRNAGFRDAVTYDRFHPLHRTRPERRFSLITCFETIEHSPDPKGLAQDISALMEDDGLLVLTTLVQPEDILKQRTNWWYVGPRNGHITLFSRTALVILWGELGYRVVFTPHPSLHFICRGTPAFARHVIG